MDKAGMNDRQLKVAPYILAITHLVLAILTIGCTSEAPKKSPVSATRTPIPPKAERVEKPLNVSFSTYSKDWPVGWQWIDPAEKDVPTSKDVRNAVLRVRIPTGKDMRPENFNAPRYIKPLAGDFQIETRVAFAPKENYQGAGLLVYLDDSRFLRFERAYGGVGGGASGLRIDVNDNNGYSPIVTPDDLPTDRVQVDLKLVRKGNLITAYWREDESGSWSVAGKHEFDLPDAVFAGLIACNTAREIIAEFAYIRIVPIGS